MTSNLAIFNKILFGDLRPNIEGTENRQLKDVLSKLKEEKIIPMKDFFDNVDKTENIIVELEENLKLIKEYIKLCEKGKFNLYEYKKYYYLENQKALDKNIKKLNKIDRQIIIKNYQINLITTVIAKVIFEIENDDKFIVKSSDTKNISFQKEFERSYSLYTRIQKMLYFCCEKIEKTISEMKGEQ